LLAGFLLAAGAVYYVLRPVFRPNAGRDAPDAGAAGVDPEDDLSPRAVALRALKEIEFDRATGKLSETDYALLKLQYTSDALTALRAEDAASEMRDARGDTSVDATHPASRLPPPASRLPHSVCPAHGPRSETGAQFCSECGRRLGAAPGYCARCGTALEQDAHYCHRCGARVAA
jgi:double zinc ribbon protein